MWLLLEISVNIVEALLFYLLLRIIVGCDPHHKLLANTGFLFIALFTTVANLTEMNTVLFYCIATVIEVLYAAFCFDRKNSIRFFLGLSLLVFSTVSNFVVTIIMTAAHPSEVAMLLQPSVFRLEGISLYLVCMIILFFSVSVIIKPKSHNHIALSAPQIIALFTVLVVNMTGMTLMLYFSIRNADNVASLLPCSIMCLISVFTSLLIIVLFYSLAFTSKKYIDEQNGRQQLEMEIMRYEQLSSALELMREIKHDTQMHLRTIRSMSTQDGSAVTEYIDSLIADSSVLNNYVHTGNDAVDAVISNCAVTTAKNNIHFQPTIILPEQLPMSAVEFCTVLGNLLSNAIDSCKRQTEEEYKYIKLIIDVKTGNLYISVKNSSTGNYTLQDGKLLTSKKNRIEHGVGIMRITKLVEKHNGIFSFAPKHDSFEATVYLPIH